MPGNRRDGPDTEDVGYYDLLGSLGVPYLHWGGLKSTDELLGLCGVSGEKEVLFVGCGTGYSACYTAQKHGCRVVGVDISEAMVSRARERAREMGLEGRVDFRVGDAYGLEFEDGAFDIVVTEFVTVFLDKGRALGEYARVLRPGGYVGVNELYISENTPKEEAETIAEAQALFEEAVGLPLIMPSRSEWRAFFEGAGLEDVHIQEIGYTYSYGEYIPALGGYMKMLGLLLRVFRIMAFDGELRRRLMKVGRLKRVIMQDRRTRKYAGAILCVGRKPVQRGNRLHDKSTIEQA
ncbi:MAG: class I SAM-dependent methyltransferase [Candidatus Bathyarchaeota archaeon]|nr:class I SAM-dependent methyltransferase [Candidatus Bathyarchaeota archaeon]